MWFSNDLLKDWICEMVNNPSRGHFKFCGYDMNDKYYDLVNHTKLL